MIDPLLSLSFNLHAHHGTYALLLGSGVSRSASIPTGWEVTLDLVAKLAHLKGDDGGGDLVGWYAAKFGKEPDYSELLSAVAPTSAAQQQLLKAYFEPSEDERAEGKKLPTDAHEAIAKLVRSGHVRIVVTTNFDRLLESALEAEGISPVVIASPDAAKGAPPLVHSRCTVIKVHGDYLDSWIKNSPEALSKYDRAMNKLLDQVFDEYGLIVCGWSGEYDTALCAALNRSKARRYPMYWAGRSEPTGQAKNIIALHGAHFLKIDGADSFFESLLEKVTALAEFSRPHPLSVKEAEATLKRYLSEDRYRIQLRDFLVSEGKLAASAVGSVFHEFEGKQPTPDSSWLAIQKLEGAMERLCHIFANGAFFCHPDHASPFIDALRRVLPDSETRQGYTFWNGLRKYPSLLLEYSAGITAIASENYALFSRLATEPIARKDQYSELEPAPALIYSQAAVDIGHAKQVIPGMTNRYTPLSDHLESYLKPILSDFFAAEVEFQRAFDAFEYLWATLHVDAKKQTLPGHSWAPVGAFGWRRWHEASNWFKNDVEAAIGQPDHPWAPLEAGLFGGDWERLSAAHKATEQVFNEICRSWF